MNVENQSGIAVYTVAGTSTARELPEWLIRKRKRSLKKDPEYANRVELLQDFAFPEASVCVRVSEDGNWVMSTGTYKPQIHTHYLPDLALNYAIHTNAENLKFILLSSDISKSLHLQSDRYLEFHKRNGVHHRLRIPRYGRDLVYNRREAEAIIPSVGVNSDGNGEVYRLNLELGRFMKSFEVEVGGDEDKALQGGTNAGSVNAASVAEESHNLLAFGTSLGTVEFWDTRSSASIGALAIPQAVIHQSRPQVTALQFQRNGMNFAAGDSTGMTYLYDLRSSTPIQKQDQGFGFPVKNIIFLDSNASFKAQTQESKILTSCKKSIKIWDRQTAKNWAWVEPDVDLNHVEWCHDSGMILTANEGRQQHSFFIPQLGPAPKWCSFLDNIVEEMAEDIKDPNAYTSTKPGAVYENFKFLTMPQLQTLNIDHLIGKTSLLRPYMHGYFVSQKLYEEASLISNPTFWEEQRSKRIQKKIETQRESRIRGRKKIKVKQNQQLVEKILEREEQNDRRKAKRALAKGKSVEDVAVEQKARKTPLNDSRFATLFEEEEFVIDENSKEYIMMNPVKKPEDKITTRKLTAVEEEMAESSDSPSGSEDDSDSNESWQQEEAHEKTQQRPKKPIPQTKITKEPAMTIRSTQPKPANLSKHKSFESRLENLEQIPTKPKERTVHVVGEQEITFTPSSNKKQRVEDKSSSTSEKKDRRSASGNVFRGM